MRGKLIDFSKLVYDKHDIGFRIIQEYYVSTDGFILRFDVKIENRQYNTVILASKSPQISRLPPATTDDMETPRLTPEGKCINTKVTKNELVKALRELADDIENDKSDNPKATL